MSEKNKCLEDGCNEFALKRLRRCKMHHKAHQAVYRKALHATRRDSGTCPKCGKQSAFRKFRCSECLDRCKNYRISLRKEVMDAYGGSHKCSCPGCSATAIEFLTIEHIGGTGAAHRKEVGAGDGIYRDLKKRGFPDKDKYCVLCMNCNIARGVKNGDGKCPCLRRHEASKLFTEVASIHKYIEPDDIKDSTCLSN